jgi:hypothetical protein
MYCLPPGASPGCGVCSEPPPDELCTADADCDPQGTPPTICDPVECACNAGDKTCQPGCTAPGDCGEGTICGAGHRCEPSPCSSPTDCPANFLCGAGKTCARATCSSDSDCDDHCVTGLCFGALGTCTYPAA